MASNLESSAVFESRAVELGFSPGEIDVMREQGWNAFGRFAFAIDYVPGQSADEAPLLAMAATITGTASGPAPPNRVPLVRRLFFESYSMTAADMRQRTERRDDDPPRRLAAAERSARYDAQVARLSPALTLTGELEPSCALIDLVQDMFDSNALQYIRWEQCTKRDQELLGVRLDPVWKPDSRGIVRESARRVELIADTSTDLLLKYALQRRSLAFDQCNLVTYQAFEIWSQVLITQYLRDVPEGYRRVSLEQVQNADLEMFKAAMRLTHRGIRPTGAGQRPLEDAIMSLKDSPDIRLYLQPLPGHDRGGSGGSGSGRGKRKAGDEDSEVARMAKRIASLEGRLRNQSSSSQSNQGGGKSGKGKGKRKTSFIKLPPALVGMDASGPDGSARCFGFNLGTCKDAKPGAKCGKGWHVCMRPGCGKPHSQLDH